MWSLIPIGLAAGMLLLANRLPPLVMGEEAAIVRGMHVHHHSLVRGLLAVPSGQDPSALPVVPLFGSSGSWHSALVESTGGRVLLTWPTDPIDPARLRVRSGRPRRGRTVFHPPIQIGTIEKQAPAVARFGDLVLRDVPDHLPDGIAVLGSRLP